MKNYTDWKDKSSGSAILEALNRGTSSNVSSFNSVDQFITGLLGPNFKREKEEDNKKIPYENKEEVDMTNSLGSSYIPPVEEETEEEDSQDPDNIIQDEERGSNYKIYRDKEETFECNIQIQGAKLSSSQARLVFDHDICNLVFYGKVYKDGKCAIPLKKMNFYPEGSSGRVRLEVIVDDTVFVPWEETFVVEGAKKVSVQIKPQKKVNFSF